jgi:hypothetical protein
MDEQARISVSLREGKLEIAGSEAFVKEQLDRYDDVIRGRLASVSPDTTPNSGDEPPTAAIESVGGNPYPNVIAVEGDEIRILKTVPGRNKAEKTVNIALLFLLASGLSGKQDATYDQIRDMCQHHSCLDSGNFAKTMNKAKEYFIITGSGRGHRAKLSHPGQQKAKELAVDLNAR